MDYINTAVDAGVNYGVYFFLMLGLFVLYFSAKANHWYNWGSISGLVFFIFSISIGENIKHSMGSPQVLENLETWLSKFSAIGPLGFAAAIILVVTLLKNPKGNPGLASFKLMFNSAVGVFTGYYVMTAFQSAPASTVAGVLQSGSLWTLDIIAAGIRSISTTG